MYNVPCHIELVSNDLSATDELYSQLFGWTIKPSGVESYYLIKFQGIPMGGAVKVEKFSKSTPDEIRYPLTYIRVQSVADTLAKAKELGVKILVDFTEIPNRCRWAVFQDNCGNQIALFEAII